MGSFFALVIRYPPTTTGMIASSCIIVGNSSNKIKAKNIVSTGINAASALALVIDIKYTASIQKILPTPNTKKPLKNRYGIALIRFCDVGIGSNINAKASKNGKDKIYL